MLEVEPILGIVTGTTSEAFARWLHVPVKLPSAGHIDSPPDILFISNLEL